MYSTIGVASAMVVFAGGGIASGVYSTSSPRAAELLWYASLALGFGLWLWGCYCHAKAKGYSGWLGGLGLLSLPGLLVLLILPDRAKSRMGHDEWV